MAYIPWNRWVLSGVLPSAFAQAPVLGVLFITPLVIHLLLLWRRGSRIGDKVHVLIAAIALPTTLKHLLFGIAPSLLKEDFFVNSAKHLCCIYRDRDCTALPEFANFTLANCSAIPAAALRRPEFLGIVGDQNLAAITTYFMRLPTALVVHTSLMAVPALLFPLLTWASLRQRYPKLHRALGRFALLGLAAGTVSVLPFFSVLSDKGYGPRAHAYLAVILMTGTYIGLQGWRAIRRKDVQAHRIWMMRLSGWMWGTFLGIRLMLIAGILLNKLLFPDHKLRLSTLWNVSNWVAPPLGILMADALVGRSPRSRDKLS